MNKNILLKRLCLLAVVSVGISISSATYATISNENGTLSGTSSNTITIENSINNTLGLTETVGEETTVIGTNVIGGSIDVSSTIEKTDEDAIGLAGLFDTTNTYYVDGDEEIKTTAGSGIKITTNVSSETGNATGIDANIINGGVIALDENEDVVSSNYSNTTIDLDVTASSAEGDATAITGKLITATGEDIDSSITVNATVTAENGDAIGIYSDEITTKNLNVNINASGNDARGLYYYDGDNEDTVINANINGTINVAATNNIIVDADTDTNDNDWSTATGIELNTINGNITSDINATNNVKISGDSTVSNSVYAITEATEINNLNGDLSGNINATATAVNEATTTSTSNTTYAVAEVCIDHIIGNVTGDITATAIAQATQATGLIYDSITLNAEATGLDVSTMKGNISGNITANASAEGNNYALSSADAIFSENNYEGNISGNISANAYAKSTDENATANAEATGITVYDVEGMDLYTVPYGDIKGDISGDITVSAQSYTTDGIADENDADSEARDIVADEIEGNISGNISVVAFAETTIEETVEEVTTTYFSGDAEATGIIASDIKGDISGDITVMATAGNDSDGSAEAYGIVADEIQGNITGDITVMATASQSEAVALDLETTGATYELEDEEGNLIYILDDEGNPTEIVATANYTTISSTITAIANKDSNGDVNATAISTGDGILYFDDATVIARNTDEEANSDGYYTYGIAITNTNYGEGLTVNGDVAIYGNVVANSPYTVNGDVSVIGGVVDATEVVIGEGSNLSLGIDKFGNMASISNNVQSITYTEMAGYTNEELNEAYSQKRNNLLADSATYLVGDEVQVGDIFADTHFYDYVEAKDLLEDDSTVNTDGNNVEATWDNGDLDADPLTATITGLSHFQAVAQTENSNQIAVALDSIVAKDETVADVDEAKANAEYNLAARDLKDTFDSANFDMESVAPSANSNMAQVNSEALSNLNMANIWKMQSTMSKSKKTSLEAEDYNKLNNVAQFQSVNMIGSQDGSSITGAGYDYYSVGGTADMDRFFGDNLFAGIGIGGIYNSVDGDGNSGDANSTNLVVNLYAMYSFDDIGLDVFATLGYSHGWNESSKSTTQGVASSDWDSDSIYHSAGVAYSIKVSDAFTIKPMAMYNLVYQNASSTSVTGAGQYNSSIDSQDFTSFKTVLGLEGIYNVSDKFDVIARLFWAHEFGEQSYDLDYTINGTSAFIGSLTSSGEEAGRDSAVIGLGVTYDFTRELSGFIDYNANIYSNRIGHNLNAGLSFLF